MRVLLCIVAVVLAVQLGACGQEDAATTDSPNDRAHTANLIVATLEPIGIRAVNTETGASKVLHAPMFSPGDARFPIIRTTSALVYRGLVYACEPPGACVLNPHPRSDFPTLVGRSECMAPSTRSDRVWLVEGRVTAAEETRRAWSVREALVSRDPKVTARRSPLPRALWHCPIGAVDAGPVFDDSKHQRLVVWDTAAREVVASVPGEIEVATHNDQIAWCDQDCGSKLNLTTVHSDLNRVATLDRQLTFLPDGAFSPDGSLLAVQVRAGNRRVNRRLAIINVKRGTVLTLARTGGGSTVWAADGRQVFMIGDRSILAYDVSTHIVREIPLEPPTGVFAIAPP